MKDPSSLDQKLIDEISALKQRIQELEKSEADRNRVEEALHNRESYLSAIIENQPGVVWLKDEDSGFLAVNQSFAISCGKQRVADLLGKTDLPSFGRPDKEFGKIYQEAPVCAVESLLQFHH